MRPHGQPPGFWPDDGKESRAREKRVEARTVREHFDGEVHPYELAHVDCDCAECRPGCGPMCGIDCEAAC